MNGEAREHMRAVTCGLVTTGQGFLNGEGVAPCKQRLTVEAIIHMNMDSAMGSST